MSTCKCEEPRLIIVAKLQCPCIIEEGKAVPVIGGAEFSACVVCEECEQVFPSMDCPFGPVRDIVAKVCTSCVEHDGKVQFRTDLNLCARPPIVGGADYESAKASG